ncbi:MAG TPA: acetylornithine deacetylase, partial [Roseiarcus sp.]|nr:acetylornithine deacetylase [Roseiarcus sp.]
MSDDRLAKAKGLLERLIAFESVSDRSNLPLIGFAEDYLAALGVACRRAPNGSQDKTALLATVG